MNRHVYVVTSWNEYEGLQSYDGIFATKEAARKKCEKEATRFLKDGWYWKGQTYQNDEEHDKYSYSKEIIR